MYTTQNQFEYLKNEIVIIEEKLIILEEITEITSTFFSEETRTIIYQSVQTLKSQTSGMEEIRKFTIEQNKKEQKVREEYFEAVNIIEKQTASLKSEFINLKSKTLSPELLVERLEEILSESEKSRDKIIQLKVSSHDIKHNAGERSLDEELTAVQIELRDAHDSIERELDNALNVSTNITEYAEALNELTHLSMLGENALEEKIVAEDLSTLSKTIHNHKKLFLSLRHCQKVLETLDLALEPSNRVQYQHMYSKSYLKASTLIDKATQRMHQLTQVESEWKRLLQQLEEEEWWAIGAIDRINLLNSVASDTYQDNTEACKVRN